MKVIAKPISSPSRVDNYPPPLLRFLKSNGSSRSRGRCRSSPIFIQNKKKNGRSSNNNQAIVTQEPTSPKVTCMGQVRVRRSKQTRKKKKKKNIDRRNGYEWIQKTLFCCHFNEKLKPKMKKMSKKSYWGRWVLPIYKRKLEIKEESIEKEARLEDFEEFEEITDDEEEEKTEVFIASSPPKNALLLMRCRSEPYRASSLANQFWGSPSITNQEEEEEEEEEECKTEQKHIKDEEDEEKPTLEKEPNCRDSVAESRIDPETEEKMGFCQDFERSSSTTTNTKIEAETSKRLQQPSSSTSRPLLLTRCKSEPATRSEKFQVETCFWKKRFEFVDISTTTTTHI